MKVKELLDYFYSIAPSWFDEKRTVDKILMGDPEAEIKKCAVSWMPSIPNLKKAIEMGCDTFITHEPLYLSFPNEYGIYIGGWIKDYHGEIQPNNFLEEEDVWIEKGKFVKNSGINVIRCHDVWDDYPEIGIHSAWAKWLGFTDKPVSQRKYYEVHSCDGKTLGEIVKQIGDKIKSLGQSCVHYIGDPDQKVSRLALGTGAITSYRIMLEMDPDVLLVTDDGIKLWESGQWSEDAGIPMIIVNHATAEEPGLIKLVDFLKEKFPEIEFEMIRHGCLYRTYC